MKNLLLATTALVLTAGAAAAEVKLGGLGRFGVQYVENDSVNTATSGRVSEITIETRLRFNIDVSVETDTGVTFGGRIRLQYDEGDATAFLAPARLNASFAGMRLEVGNANTAYDSAALMYNSEIGFRSFGSGDPQGDYFSYDSDNYTFSADTSNRMGLFFSYEIEGFNGRLSYVDPDQTNALITGNIEEELSISADYNFGQFTISGAAVQNGAGIIDNDQYFLGGEYEANDIAVGLLYFDNGEVSGVDQGGQFTLYGNYTTGPTTLKAFVANWDKDGLENDTAYGIGAGYSLGDGVSIAGGVEYNYSEKAEADLGVVFNF